MSYSIQRAVFTKFSANLRNIVCIYTCIFTCIYIYKYMYMYVYSVFLDLVGMTCTLYMYMYTHVLCICMRCEMWAQPADGSLVVL